MRYFYIVLRTKLYLKKKYLIIILKIEKKRLKLSHYIVLLPMSKSTSQNKNRKAYFAIYRKIKVDQIKQYNDKYYLKNQEAVRSRRRERYQKMKAKKLIATS